ncbi:ATP-dependent DNA helicase DinG [Bacillus alveayuensis]|jgi:ATP-dependent DNA helicase DinG|uniref:ATP-dependent DNA helicase DinG n=1 Tax=Aeribacillus alveayuensis TaxID=279215 RepID=UPI0005CD9A6A|nr:ATP-dependent DNA helicase DinG [Bacillus alveayuensis]
MNQRFVVIDLETTGNSPRSGDRIIQIGIVVIENEQIVERFSSFIHPERVIPPFIQQLTGINEELIEGAPRFQELAPTVAKLLEKSYFVAHNVSFDLSFLQAELQMAGFPLFSGPKIDTVELSRILIPTVESYKLSELAQALNLPHENPHQADSDAEVTAKLFLALLKRLKSLPVVTLQQLQRLSPHLKSDLHHLLDEVIGEKLLSLNEERQFRFYQGIALKKDYIKETSSHGGASSFQQFSERFQSLPISGYEHRLGQWEMMKDVNEAFETSQHALIEAGTGIGKSLAYLIPSLFFSYENKKPVVISTHTLQLQEQLIERDIPVLQNIVSFPFKVAVLKGKRNYLSLRKFVRFLHEQDKNYDTVLTKCQLLVWLTETETGDVDELNLSSGGKLIWSTLQIDNDDEPVEKDIDFFQRAKKRALDAHLIITNHSFLLQDLTGDTPLLPAYEYLLVDEAHHLEDVAANYFGQQVSYVTIRQLLKRIGRLEEDGWLAKIKTVCTKLEIGVGNIFYELDQLMADLQFEFDEWFRMIRRYVMQRKNKTDAVRIRYRFQPLTEKGSQWKAINELLWRLIDHTNEWLKKLNDLEMLLRQKEQEIERLSYEFVFDYFTDATAFSETVEALQHLLLSDDELVVRWMEVEVKGAANAITIYSQPIQLEEFFADRLFAKKKSVVLTSATLTTNGTYSYIISRLGLNDFYPKCITIPSPFNYKEQVKLMIPSDLPSISDVSLEEYAHSVAIQLMEIAEHTNGKMLVLFTSYELLKLTVAMMKEMDIDERFVLIAQGVNSGSAAKLTKSFRQFDQAILLGTSNFWEGVDLPGEELSCLVIVRLPFAPPDDPVIEAKCEQIRVQGGNPFYDLSLPEAIIRFKQGFGRLIRSSHDKGVVFVFDRRLTTASYGKYFLSSLPPLQVYEEPLHSLLPKLEQWLS